MIAATRGRWQLLTASVTPAEWGRLAMLFGVVAALHIVGFALLLGVVDPHHLTIGTGSGFGVGVGITAYTLGMRHAFDADHIAAIDNTTRKLMSDGQRPLSVGFFFSLGHSTIVFVLATGLAVGIRGLGGAVADHNSPLRTTTDLIGPIISGSFLILIGVLNLVVLVGILKIARRMRQGDFTDGELEAQLNRRGLLNRIYARATRSVTKPWQMYPVGMLFGLGFDTATEIALLAVAGAAAVGHLPIYAILCLPILFAAGMSLLDTIDGVCMNLAYGWAFAQPIRKIFYNATVTALSVAVALLIGMIELAAVLATKFNLNGGPWSLVSHIDLNLVGYLIAALFAATWMIALAVWHMAGIERRWAPTTPESSR